VTEILDAPVEAPAGLPETPYVGLVPFDERDAPFFFGRERERRLIAANLIASRLTLLYGASGVGKSSVLRAGVAHDLRELARRELAQERIPESILVVFASWRDPPLPLLASAIEDAVAETLGGLAPEAPPASDHLDDLLADWVRRIDAIESGDGRERRTRLLIVLDQFEEYFLYQWREEDEGLLGLELPRAINREGLRANFVISIREDAYAQLDRFKGRVPNLFDSYLRVRHLDHEAARRAIRLPVEETWNGLLPEGATPYAIEDELVEEVLRQVRTGSVVLGPSGGGSVGETAERRVEAPFLQLVMRRLWLETVAARSHKLTVARLQDLGGAEAIVRANLQDALAGLEPHERDLAARIFRQLVTPEGTKIAHTVGALAQYADVEPEELLPTLKTLADGRILRPVDPPPGQSTPRYEIYHDVLAAPVLEWSAEHTRAQREAERRKEERRRWRARRNAVVAGVLAVALAVAAALAVWAIFKRDDAVRLGNLARSQELANVSLAQIAVDPERAVLLALEAVHSSPTPQAEDALRAALAQSYLRRVLAKDSSDVNSAVYSRDGKLVVTASGDRTVRVWDAGNGRELRVFTAQRPVGEAVIDPAGSRVAAAAGSAGPLLWNAHTGRRIRLEGELPRATTVVFSPDGSLVAAGGPVGEGRTAFDVDVWRASKGALVQTFSGHTGPIYHVRFSPDGHHLVSASADHTARIWTLGRAKPVVIRHAKNVNDASFSPDGRLVATAGWDGIVKLSHLDGSPVRRADGTQVGPFSVEGSRVYSVAFSPRGDLVAAGSQNRLVYLWSLAGRRRSVLRGHTGAVYSVSFSPSGELVSASADGTARVWDVGRTEARAVLRGHTGALRTALFSPDGAHVVTASSDHTARIWDIAPPRRLAVLRSGGRPSFHPSSVGVAFSPAGHTLLVRNGFDGARLYRASGARLATLAVHGGGMTAATFSPDRKLLVTVTATGPAQVWDTRSGRLVHELRGHKPSAIPGLPGEPYYLIRTAEFSPDGKLLATAGYDGTARIWDTTTWKTLHVLSSPGRRVLTTVTFSPDGTKLATAGWFDGTVRVWNVANGRLLESLRGTRLPAVYPACASFSPDSTLLVTCGNGIAYVWDLTSGRGRVQTVLRGHTGPVASAVFSPDGTLVATTGSDGTARVWDVTTGAVDTVVDGVGAWPAVFDADGSLLAAGGSVVEARTGERIADLGATHDPRVSAISPGGRLAATMSVDGVGGLYTCDLCEPLPQLVKLAERRVTRTLTQQERTRFVSG
jgi:WD40 repeat protein